MHCKEMYKRAEDVQEWDFEVRRMYWGLPVEERERFYRMMKRTVERLKRGDLPKT